MAFLRAFGFEPNTEISHSLTVKFFLAQYYEETGYRWRTKIAYQNRYADDNSLLLAHRTGMPAETRNSAGIPASPPRVSFLENKKKAR
jgi:hypothetical protein